MISKIEPKDCKQVAYLHIKNLRTPFEGELGRKMLQLYYLALCEEQGACGYVAKKNGKVLGYVCAVWEPQKLKINMLRRFGIALGVLAISYLLIKPSAMKGFTSRLVDKKKVEKNTNDYELRPIIVVPEERGTGLAFDLVSILLKDASERGFVKVHLFVEIENYPAVNFYQKFGFGLVGEESKNGLVYHRFEHSTIGFS